MIIKEINLNHFGRFHDKHITLGPGINLIYGPNEAGKSTVHAFIRGMLFGIEKPRGRVSKEHFYSRFEPWDSPAIYQGSMVIEIEGIEYRINRNFYKKEKKVEVINVQTGRVVASNEAGVKKLLKGLTDSVYSNTVSMEQLKAKTENELAVELKNYITNLSMSKSTEVDVNQALDYLGEQKKKLEKTIPKQQIAALDTSIEKEEESIRQCEELNKELVELMAELTEVKKERESYTNASGKDRIRKILMLPAIKEKYKSYCELMDQKQIMEKRLASLSECTKRAVEELDNSLQIQSHLEELHQLRNEKQQYEEELRKNRTDWENHQKSGKINGKYLGVILCTIGALLCVVPIGNAVVRCMIGMILVVCGIIGYVVTATRQEREMHKMEQMEKDFEKKVFALHSKRHDILLQHRVSNETQLVIKFNEITKNELEKEQTLERKAEYLLSLNNIKQKTDQLELEIISFMKYFIDDPEANDSCMAEMIQVIEEDQEDLEQGRTKCQKRFEELNQQIERIRWTLESNHNQEALLLQNKEERERLLLQDDELSKEVAAISLSTDTLKELSAEIHDTFGSRLNDMVSDRMEKISHGECSRVVIDEALNIKVLKKDRYVSLEQLSAGTIDQMYLALRLSVAQLLFPEEKLPIILDDAFTLYDDSRIKNALYMLQEQAKRQIIIFTCHNREREVMEELGTIKQYIEL